MLSIHLRKDYAGPTTYSSSGLTFPVKLIHTISLDLMADSLLLWSDSANIAGPQIFK